MFHGSQDDVDASTVAAKAFTSSSGKVSRAPSTSPVMSTNINLRTEHPYEDRKVAQGPLVLVALGFPARQDGEKDSTHSDLQRLLLSQKRPDQERKERLDGSLL
jgi:hypothetical protein